nr:MAG TPA: hypothetical protein [Caudoviricetes sp.]
MILTCILYSASLILSATNLPTMILFQPQLFFIPRMPLHLASQVHHNTPRIRK